MQHAMLRWIETADARTALEQPQVILVPRNSGVTLGNRFAHFAAVLATLLAVFGR